MMAISSSQFAFILLLSVASLHVLGQEQAKAQDDGTVLAADGTKDAMPSAYGYGRSEGHDNHQPFYDTLYPGSASCPCPACPLPAPPPRTWCGCSCPLNFATLNTTNGCNAGTFSQNQFCNGCNTGDFEFCTGYNNGTGGGGGDLCYRATCPQDGIIRIQGRAGAVNCCGGVGTVYIFNGTYIPGNFANLLAVANGTAATGGYAIAQAPCTAGQQFDMCETNSIFLTAFTQFTFFELSQNACPQGCTPLGPCSSTPNFVNAMA